MSWCLPQTLRLIAGMSTRNAVTPALISREIWSGASLGFYEDPKRREESSGLSAALPLVPEAVVPYQSRLRGAVETSCLSRASQRPAVAPITWSASALPQAAPFSKSPSILAIWFVT